MAPGDGPAPEDDGHGSMTTGEAGDSKYVSKLTYFCLPLSADDLLLISTLVAIVFLVDERLQKIAKDFLKVAFDLIILIFGFGSEKMVSSEVFSLVDGGIVVVCLVILHSCLVLI